MQVPAKNIDAQVLDKLQFLTDVTFSTLLFTFGEGKEDLAEALEQSLERLIASGKVEAKGKAVPRYSLAGLRPCTAGSGPVEIPEIAPPPRFTNLSPELGTLSLKGFMAPARDGADDFRQVKSLSAI